MRKMFVIAVASCAMLAITPATALAHHHGRRGHHARFHHKRFGRAGSQTPAAPAATVVSFTNGVLTIKANDGNTASGMVTNDTELICITPGQSGMWSHDRNRGGGGWDEGGDNGQGDDDSGANQTCTTSALVAGAIVQKAVLTISSAGATWDKVELITQSSSSTSVTDTDNDGD